MAGEASSSRQKRQRLVEEEDENGGGDAAVARSGTLVDLDLFYCPVCSDSLTIPIFRCDNGHIACSSCCTKMKNVCPDCGDSIGDFRCLIMEKILEAFNVDRGFLFDLHLLDCPVCSNALTAPIFECDSGHIACSSCCKKQRYKCTACSLPIGNYRCRIMERLVEAIFIPCPNAKHGCREMFYYGKKLVHQKECIFAPCYCPALGCNYSGMYKDLYSHYETNHKCGKKHFRSGHDTDAWVHVDDKILVLQEYRDGPLVVIQCFEKPEGVSVTVNCIAPSAPGVGEFSFLLSYSREGEYWALGSDKMNRIQKVSFQAPEKCFITVPMSDFKMKIRINRINEEKENEV